jgi:hypothetical protein
MDGWDERDLDTIGGAQEVDIAPDDQDGSPGPAATIWVVRLGDRMYVRSYRGQRGHWFQRALRAGAGAVRANDIERAVTFEPHGTTDREAIDIAYRTKYRHHARAFVEPMVSDVAAATTTELVPTRL